MNESIVQRLMVLGWVYGPDGVLANPKGSPKLKETRDSIGTRYWFPQENRACTPDPERR